MENLFLTVKCKLDRFSQIDHIKENRLAVALVTWRHCKRKEEMDGPGGIIGHSHYVHKEHEFQLVIAVTHWKC